MVGIIGGADGPPAVYLDINIGLLALAIVIAYFIGCISPSIMLAKARGIDIKKEGSGNAGTTNALRVMGKKAGVITLIVDILKGVIAVLIGNLIAGPAGGMCAAVAAFCGHVWPVFYKFKGGKGVATAFGVLLGINVWLALAALAVVAIGVLVTKRMSVGSILGAACFPILAYFLEPAFIIPGSALALCIIIKHKANIVRLIHGEEPIMSIFDKSKEK
ncbi:MAG: glycerol-3-phosphate 1-O-acyltransferase PlsY [Firmicutes bacterium]|nr:glycerol-3-phosphate 1-O-acyltransferase PlsY [Bacillota bacterium]